MDSTECHDMNNVLMNACVCAWIQAASGKIAELAPEGVDVLINNSGIASKREHTALNTQVFFLQIIHEKISLLIY